MPCPACSGWTAFRPISPLLFHGDKADNLSLGLGHEHLVGRVGIDEFLQELGLFLFGGSECHVCNRDPNYFPERAKHRLEGQCPKTLEVLQVGGLEAPDLYSSVLHLSGYVGIDAGVARGRQLA